MDNQLHPSTMSSDTSRHQGKHAGSHDPEPLHTPTKTFDTQMHDLADHRSQQSSPEPSGQPKISSRKRSAYNALRKLWVIELAAALFSIFCLLVIVGLLVRERHKPLDDWHISVSPTAIVSFLATLAKSSFLLVLTEVISQLKWLHFTTGAQRLNDLDVSTIELSPDLELNTIRLSTKHQMVLWVLFTF